MKLYAKLFFIVIVAISQVTSATASFKKGPSGKCYVDDTLMWYPDEFWYCGTQDKGCAGAKQNSGDDAHWLGQGDKFSHDGKTYWCCEKQNQQFVDGEKWIVSTETVTETVPGGRCTWQRKMNICGVVDNPQDQCTEATTCADGFIRHNDKCVAPCQDGYAYSSSVDETCIPCEPSAFQGVIGGVCTKCETDSFFSKTQLNCVRYSDMTQVSALAYEQCWMCSTPGATYECLKTLSTNGTLDSNSQLQKACSVNSKEQDATAFKLPATALHTKSYQIQLKSENKPVSTTTENFDLKEILTSTSMEDAMEKAKNNPFKNKQ